MFTDITRLILHLASMVPDCIRGIFNSRLDIVSSIFDLVRCIPSSIFRPICRIFNFILDIP